jgi:hypothetical protein
MRKLIPLILLISVGSGSVSYAQSFVDFYNESIAAYRASDYEGFLYATQKADSARPNHPSLLYNLANAYVLNGQIQSALEALERRTHFFAQSDFTKDEDLEGLQDHPRWNEVVKLMEQLNTPHSEAELAFSFEYPGFHPEGIVYYQQKELFLISDIHTGTIFSVQKDGSELTEILRLPDFGYWSALALHINPGQPDQVWVTTSSIPNFKYHTPENEGRSAVLLLDIERGRLLESYELTGGTHNFGEVVIGQNGEVFISDSGVEPVVYKLNRETLHPEAFVRDTRWWNLQGLAFSEDGNWMYVSDYITGIYRVDMFTKEITPLIEQNEWLRGGDGIYFKDNRLFILQNGTVPKRMASIHLNDDGLGIFDTLEFPHNATRELEEPTLGTWVNNDFYYIANSPWGYYDEDNQPMVGQWPNLYIYRLKHAD